MSDKEWYIVTTRPSADQMPGELYRYAVEYQLQPFDGFESPEHWRKWYEGAKAYFVERTGIKEEVICIEPAQFISAYPTERKKA